MQLVGLPAAYPETALTGKDLGCGRCLDSGQDIGYAVADSGADGRALGAGRVQGRLLADEQRFLVGEDTVFDAQFLPGERCITLHNDIAAGLDEVAQHGILGHRIGDRVGPEGVGLAGRIVVTFVVVAGQDDVRALHTGRVVEGQLADGFVDIAPALVEQVVGDVDIDSAPNGCLTEIQEVAVLILGIATQLVEQVVADVDDDGRVALRTRARQVEQLAAVEVGDDVLGEDKAAERVVAAVGQLEEVGGSYLPVGHRAAVVLEAVEVEVDFAQVEACAGVCAEQPLVLQVLEGAMDDAELADVGCRGEVERTGVFIVEVGEAGLVGEGEAVDDQGVEPGIVVGGDPAEQHGMLAFGGADGEAAAGGGIAEAAQSQGIDAVLAIAERVGLVVGLLAVEFDDIASDGNIQGSLELRHVVDGHHHGLGAFCVGEDRTDIAAVLAGCEQGREFGNGLLCFDGGQFVGAETDSGMIEILSQFVSDKCIINEFIRFEQTQHVVLGTETDNRV